MFILSKFKDYYDSSVGLTGIDKTCVYERNQFSEPTQYDFIQAYKKFEGDKIGWSSAPFIANYSSKRKGQIIMNVKINPFVIGFCGKTYVGHRIRIHSPKQNLSAIAYNIEEFLKYVPVSDNTTRSINNGEYCINKDNLKRIKSYYDKYNNKDHSELFIKHHVPSFVIDYDTGLIDACASRDLASNSYNRTTAHNAEIVYNPCLKNYEFYRIFGSGHAFQEIQMYLQGVIGTKEKISTVLTDNEKITQHGFDKFSFRKDPSN